MIHSIFRPLVKKHWVLTRDASRLPSLSFLGGNFSIGICRLPYPGQRLTENSESLRAIGPISVILHGASFVAHSSPSVPRGTLGGIAQRQALYGSKTSSFHDGAVALAGAR